MALIGIVGGSGYTGVELLRLLLPRTDVEVSFVSSRANEGIRLDNVFPNLRGHTDLEFSAPDPSAMAECDLVFYATPNGTAMHAARALLDKGVKVVDLSADFRFKDKATYEAWYSEHADPDLLAEAAYGLPELCRDEIRSARLVGNPGCYPTAVQIGFLPLLENGLVDPQFLIADCKSGVSGAGRGSSVDRLFGEVNDSFKPYATAGHRHQPEIEQGLQRMANGEAVDLTFSAHLLPIIRGIEASLYARLTSDISLDDLQQLYVNRFQSEPFVDVLDTGSHPETRTVKGTNMCRLAVHKPLDRDKVVILSVEDNLVKGAAGQAVQCMNLMLGLEETAGLTPLALLP